MNSQWEVSDFKGLESAKIDLAPGKLSVIAGANSSGKSSVLQSILMVSQSLYHDGPLVLNGPLTRLGVAADLIRASSINGSIRLNIDYLEGTRTGSQRPASAAFDLVPTSDDSSLRIQKLNISFRDDNHEGRLELDSRRSRSHDTKNILAKSRTLSFTDLLHVKTILGKGSRTLRTYVAFSGLLPIEVIMLDSADSITRAYRSQIETIFKDFEATDRTVPSIIREFSSLLHVALKDESEEWQEPYSTIRKITNGNPYRFSNSWDQLSDVQRSRAIELASIERGKTDSIRIPLQSAVRVDPRVFGRYSGILEANLEEKLTSSISALKDLGRELVEIGHRVQYLGPLRDEPRVVWNQWNELARGLPVGSRGEYSAAVLSRSKNHTVQYVNPAGSSKTSALLDAVNEWLEYLDIGDGVTTINLGKLGVGLELELDGHKRDLTAVGVGVSQALPLVAGVLAVAQGAIFIVEQPELHLHPAVQSRLADFLTMARPDLTILVETHSESFLTRVRRRVAESKISPNRVDLVFIDKSIGGAISRNLKLTQFGDLSEWPSGFLGNSMEDTTAIIQANLKRIRDSSSLVDSEASIDSSEAK